MISSGTAPVRIVVIGLPSACRQVQVGAFRDPDNARELLDDLRDSGLSARSERGGDDVIRVIVGPFDALQARQVRDRYDGVIQPC
jgi:cell division septation protein DedD